MICPKPLSVVVNKEIKWLWKPFIPYGKVTLLQGDTGIGKTSLMIKLIADLSNGIYPPTMYRKKLLPSQQGEPVRTYYVSVENGMDDTVAPLFDQFNGDRSFVQFQDESQGHFTLCSAEIEACVEQTGAQLIIIDPWQQFLDNGSSSDNVAMRKMVYDVQTAAEKTGAAVVLAGNYTKSLGSELRRGIGGSELNNTLRCILTIQDDPDGDPAFRILRVTKMSLLGKEMVPVGIRMTEEGQSVYEDYAQREGQFDNEGNDKVDPVQFLRQALRDGPLDSKVIRKLAEDAHIEMYTLYRNREKAGVDLKEQPDKSSLWRLKRC